MGWRRASALTHSRVVVAARHSARAPSAATAQHSVRHARGCRGLRIACRTAGTDQQGAASPLDAVRWAAAQLLLSEALHLRWLSVRAWLVIGFDQRGVSERRLGVTADEIGRRCAERIEVVQCCSSRRIDRWACPVGLYEGIRCAQLALRAVRSNCILSLPPV